MTSKTHKRPEYQIKVAESKDEIEACYDIRMEVFAVEQGFPDDTEIDEYDPISVHLLLTTTAPSPPDTATSSLTPPASSSAADTTQKPIGTIRYTASLHKVSRVVVLKEYRQYGFGRVLMDAVHDYAATHDSTQHGKIRLKLHSQMPAIPFYEKMGYRGEGDVFDEEGAKAPHLAMVRDIQFKAS